MIALARKYRPKTFADLIVQDHVAAALRGAVARGRVAHGYLFAGPRGVGKTTAARILAMALNCERRAPAGEPCGECTSCTRIWTGAANLDVVELDAASNRGVDDARDLRERAMYAASTEARHKVYIVDEAHMLTREAWNALLKILEEPPPRVVFVFATTEPQKIAQSAAPILSRLQRFDFRRIGPHAIRARLSHVLAAEGLEADDDALHLIAKSADGGMRDALSILDQVLSFGEGPVTAARVREVLGLIPDDVYGETLRLIADRDAKAVFPLVDRLVDAGADLQEFIAGAGDTLRAVLLAGLGGEPEGLTEGMRAQVRKYCPLLPAPDVVRLLAVLTELEGQLRSSGNARLAVELLLLRWAMMSRTVELEAVLKALAVGGTGGQAVSPSAAAVPPVLRDTAAFPAARPPAAVPLPEKGPLTLDRLRALWPRVVDDARAKSPLLGALLAETEVRGVEGTSVVVRPLDTNPVHVEGIERQRDALAQLVGRYVSAPIRIKVAGPGGGERAPARPARLTEDAVREQRLKALRARDPSLNAAVDALDLELLE
ncbi:MAG TPA: DNA polymerase III subunit gamma/tau [Gemmatimonadales bacterium]|nr:DNA polymerase III subunit gamma/tau [Gemmatimonadales bacterium]